MAKEEMEKKYLVIFAYILCRTVYIPIITDSIFIIVHNGDLLLRRGAAL